ncbi:hypothetical protein ACET9N_09215 [Aeromonas veronii]|uniref:hypothetical protein n=1 Tax=Aeromonas veronii TaxID=654 RepID=UPI003003F909
MRIKLEVILAYFLTMSLCLQIGYLFNGASRFIPLRVIIVLSLFFLIKNLASTIKINLKYVKWLVVLSIIQIVYLLFWIEFFTDELLSRTIGNFIYIVCFYILFDSICNKLSRQQLLNVCKFGCYFFLFLLVIETVLRFTFPALNVSQLDSNAAQKVESDAASIYEGSLSIFDYFYSFKYSSVMFFDSNYVGLMGLLIVFCIKFIKRNQLSSRQLNVAEVVAIGIVVFSFSRAAMIAGVLFYGTYYFVKIRSLSIKVSLFITLITSVLLVIFASDFHGLNDGSLETKLQIMESLYSKFDSVTFTQFIFGAGPVVGGYVFSYKDGGYAHALIPLVVGEMGIVGMVMVLVLYIYMIVKFRVWGWLFTIITFVPGLSLIDPYQVMYYWTIVLLHHIRITDTDIDVANCR